MNYNLLRLKQELSGPVITYVRTDFKDEHILKGCGKAGLLNDSLEYPVFSTTYKSRRFIFMVTGSGSSNVLTALHEGVGKGLRTVVRLGACGGLGRLKLGSIVVADSALCIDKISKTLIRGARVATDRGLVDGVVHELEREGVTFTRGTVASVDAMYLFENDIGRAKNLGACAWDLETAMVLAFGKRFGVRAASVLLVVSDEDGRSVASYPPIRSRNLVRCVLNALAAI
jgi:uridine phosphorylase